MRKKRILKFESTRRKARPQMVERCDALHCKEQQHQHVTTQKRHRERLALKCFLVVSNRNMIPKNNRKNAALVSASLWHHTTGQQNVVRSYLIEKLEVDGPLVGKNT